MKAYKFCAISIGFERPLDRVFLGIPNVQRFTIDGAEVSWEELLIVDSSDIPESDYE